MIKQRKLSMFHSVKGDISQMHFASMQLTEYNMVTKVYSFLFYFLFFNPRRFVWTDLKLKRPDLISHPHSAVYRLDHPTKHHVEEEMRRTTGEGCDVLRNETIVTRWHQVINTCHNQSSPWLNYYYHPGASLGFMHGWGEWDAQGVREH